jgi:prefoldin subunit 5
VTNSPFNACDYLCEKCAEKQNCRVYALLEEKALSKRLKGSMTDHGASLEDVKESLDETIELLKKIADDLGVRLEEMGDEMDGLDEQYVENDELYQLALTFTLKSHAFLKRIEPYIQQGLREAFEELVWYHTIVSVKTHRAVSSDFEGLSEDAINSARVATKSLTRCASAFDHIGKNLSLVAEEARTLSTTARAVQQRVMTRFALHQQP